MAYDYLILGIIIILLLFASLYVMICCNSNLTLKKNKKNKKYSLNDNNDIQLYLNSLTYYIDTSATSATPPQNLGIPEKFGILSAPNIQYYTNQNSMLNVYINGIVPDSLIHFDGSASVQHSVEGSHKLSGDNTGGFIPTYLRPSTGEIKPCPSSRVVNGITYNNIIDNGSPNYTCSSKTLNRRSIPRQCTNPDYPYLGTFKESCFSGPYGWWPGASAVCADPNYPFQSNIRWGNGALKNPSCYANCATGFHPGDSNNSSTLGRCYPDVDPIVTREERVVCDVLSTAYPGGFCLSSIQVSGNTQATQKHLLIYDSNYNIPLKGYSNVLYLNSDGTLPYIQTGPFTLSFSPISLNLLPASPEFPNSTNILQISCTSISINTHMLLSLQPAWNNVKCDILLQNTNGVQINIPVFIGQNSPSATAIKLNNNPISGDYIYLLPQNQTNDITIDLTTLHYTVLTAINTFITLIADGSTAYKEHLGNVTTVVSAFNFLVNLYEAGTTIPILSELTNSLIKQGLNVNCAWKTNIKNVDSLAQYITSLLIPQLNLYINNSQEDMPLFGWVSGGFVALILPYLGAARIAADIVNIISTAIAATQAYYQLKEVVTTVKAILRGEQLAEGVETGGFSIFKTVLINLYADVSNPLLILKKLNDIHDYILNDNFKNTDSFFIAILKFYLIQIFTQIGINNNIANNIPNLSAPPDNWQPVQIDPSPNLPMPTPPPSPPNNYPSLSSAITDFSFTGSQQSFNIPANYTTLTFYIFGGGGGSHNRSIGGNGAYISGSFILPTNQQNTIIISVGQGGKQFSSGVTSYGGGGSSVQGSSGGGCSCIALNNTNYLIAVAGGGGGCGVQANGGHSDHNGEDAGYNLGGKKGTVDKPGNGGLGTGGSNGSYGHNILIEGNVGTGGNAQLFAGGGGGGYNGGGSGGSFSNSIRYGGGGGGSSFKNRIVHVTASTIALASNQPFQISPRPGISASNSDGGNGFIRIVLS